MDQPERSRVIRRLTAPPRPLICRYVSDDGAIPVDELASNLAPAGGSHGDESNPGRARGRITTNLHHVHLPKLDEVDVVDYDPDRRRVGPDRNLTIAEECIDTLNLVERVHEANY